MRHFTRLADFTNLGILIERAFECKRTPHAWRTMGIGRTLGMLFFNPSLRTRVSTHRSATLLGMDVISMTVGSETWQLETRDGVVMDGAAAEHIREAAAVLGRYVDVLGIRTFAQLQNREEDYAETILKRFCTDAGIPIVSLESATHHPLQSLADVMTIEQFKRCRRPRVVLTWALHPKALPQAVANSFAEWALAMEYDLVISHPPATSSTNNSLTARQSPTIKMKRSKVLSSSMPKTGQVTATMGTYSRVTGNGKSPPKKWIVPTMATSCTAFPSGVT
jgi:N-succinyl-L-ornithine transcarbamylase